MCTNSNVLSLSLKAAVAMQVQEFIDSSQSFSRYDITTTLRQKCNDGLLEIPEKEARPANRLRFNIRKADVDAEFEKLLPDFSTLTSVYNSDLGYRMFSVSMQNTLTAPTVPAASPLVVSVASTVPTPPPVSVPVSDITRRVELYLRGCAQRGCWPPSMKNIQGAIKRGRTSTFMSGNEIRNIAASLGFTL